MSNLIHNIDCGYIKYNWYKKEIYKSQRIKFIIKMDRSIYEIFNIGYWIIYIRAKK